MMRALTPHEEIVFHLSLVEGSLGTESYLVAIGPGSWALGDNLQVVGGEGLQRRRVLGLVVGGVHVERCAQVLQIAFAGRELSSGPISNKAWDFNGEKNGKNGQNNHSLEEEFLGLVFGGRAEFKIGYVVQETLLKKAKRA